MEVVAPELSIRLLHNPNERQAIAHLRQYADFESEYELDPVWRRSKAPRTAWAS